MHDLWLDGSISPEADTDFDTDDHGVLDEMPDGVVFGIEAVPEPPTVFEPTPVALVLRGDRVGYLDSEIAEEKTETGALNREKTRAQVGLVEVGRQSLAEQGQDPASITQDVAFAEGDRLRQEALASADVELDPRLGSFEDGVVGPRSSELSVPVSDVAVQGNAAEPQPGAAGSLPASQTCR